MENSRAVVVNSEMDYFQVVAEPGLKTLEPGARVADALDAAQPLPGAETLALNHAQRLTSIPCTRFVLTEST